jgi:hypothetical protein
MAVRPLPRRRRDVGSGVGVAVPLKVYCAELIEKSPLLTGPNRSKVPVPEIEMFQSGLDRSQVPGQLMKSYPIMEPWSATGILFTFTQQPDTGPGVNADPLKVSLPPITAALTPSRVPFDEQMAGLTPNATHDGIVNVTLHMLLA